MDAPTPEPDLSEHVAKLLAEAPPLTDAQRDRIAALLLAGSRDLDE